MDLLARLNPFRRRQQPVNFAAPRDPTREAEFLMGRWPLESEHYDYMRELLTAGGVNVQTLFNYGVRTCTTDGELQMLQLFLEHGAKANCMDGHMDLLTIIVHNAATTPRCPDMKCPELIKLLIEHGADWRKVSQALYTDPLLATHALLPVQSLAPFLDAGADPFVPNSYGQTLEGLYMARSANREYADPNAYARLFAAARARQSLQAIDAAIPQSLAGRRGSL